MKKLLLILLCLPMIGFGQLNIFTTITEGTTSDGPINGWEIITENSHVLSSEYDISNNSLNSKKLDTSIVDGFDEAKTCFDAVNNIIYSIYNQDNYEYIFHNKSTNSVGLELLAYDVTTGLSTIHIIDSIIKNHHNQINDTLVSWSFTESIAMECWDNSVYFITSIIKGTTQEDGVDGWEMFDEESNTVFSEYDILSGTLNSQMFDTTREDGITQNLVTCFDPVNNIIYGIPSGDFDEDQEGLDLFAYDLTIEDYVLYSLDSIVVDFNIENDTLIEFAYTEAISMECWDNSVYFITSVVEGNFMYDTTHFDHGWSLFDEYSYSIWSEFAVSSNTLNSHHIDTSVMDGFTEFSSTCFDPYNNVIYGTRSQDIDEDLMLVEFDVTNGSPTISYIDSIIQNYQIEYNDSLVDWAYTQAIVMEFIYKLPLDCVINVTGCESYYWNYNIYDTSGIYTYTTTNAIGLDSVVTLDLIINNSTSNTTTVSVCDTYTWAKDGNTYTNSGTYTDVSTNTDGCDHTETLDLTINSVIASISQSGDSLFAVTTPIGLTANWYNIQTKDATTRIWLMQEDASSFIPKFECSYFIVLNDNGCVDTSETYYYGANAARIGSIITSPNPTSGLINVKFDNSKNQFVMLELISNKGSKLDEFITIDNNLNIDLSKYPSGTYYLYFDSEDATTGCALEEVQKISTKIILNK